MIGDCTNQCNREHHNPLGKSPQKDRRHEAQVSNMELYYRAVQFYLDEQPGAQDEKGSLICFREYT